MENNDIIKPGADAKAMEPALTLAYELMEGVEKLRKSSKYKLPKFPNEDDKAYKFRNENSKFENIYGDVLEGLASKPFTKEVTADKYASGLEDYIENVDGQNTSLHNYAKDAFYDGVNDGVFWTFVESSKAPEDVQINSQADYKSAGVRPYFVRIPARDVLQVKSEVIDGRDQLTLFRYKEMADVEDKDEREERVRKLTRRIGEDGTPVVSWEVWAERKKGNTHVKEWMIIDSGVYSVMDEIPIVPFITGRRRGASWNIKGPMCVAANLQFEHYLETSAQKFLMNWTAYPILTNTGMDKPESMDDIVVSPMSTLWGTAGVAGETAGSWSIISPDAAIIELHKGAAESTGEQIRELGRQPLTAQSPNLTVISSAAASKKGVTAAQAWAISLAQHLERCLALMGKWVGNPDTEPTVDVDKEFDVLIDDSMGMKTILEMYKVGAISLETYWDAAVRRGVLRQDFDPDEERARMAKDLPGGEDDFDTDEVIENGA